MVEEQAEPQPLQQAAIQIMRQSVTTPMPEFFPDAKIGTSLSTRWNNWQTDFEMYITASGIMDSKGKRGLLLYQAGPRARKIFKQILETGTDTDYNIAILRPSKESAVRIRSLSFSINNSRAQRDIRSISHQA